MPLKKLLIICSLLVVVPVAAQDLDLEIEGALEGLELPFIFPQDTHPLDVRDGLLDYFEVAEDEDFADLHYLLFEAAWDEADWDEQDGLEMFRLLGLKEENRPETLHPADARLELVSFVQEADHETLELVNRVLRDLFVDPELMLTLFAWIQDEDEPMSIASAKTDDKNRGKNTDWESGNCWDRIPKKDYHPRLGVFPAREIAQHVCKQKPKKCRAKKLAYRAYAKFK
jgi:hypothetical protein